MPKYRVFELAKEFGATSKVILDILVRNDIQVKNHMSSVDESGKEIVARTFARKTDSVNTAPVEKKVVKTETAPVKPKQAEVSEKPVITKEVKKPEQTIVQDTAPKVQQVQKPVAREPFKPKSFENKQQEAKKVFKPDNRPPARQGGFTGSNNTYNKQSTEQRKPNTSPSSPRQDNYRPNPGQDANRNVQQNRQAFVPKSQTPATGGQQRNNSFNNNTGVKKTFPAKTDATNQRPANAQGGSKFFNNQKKKNKYQDKRTERNQNVDKNKGGRSNKAGAFIMPTVNVEKPTHVELPLIISVKDLATTLKRDIPEVIKCLLNLGIMATINQEIDFDTASLVASEFQVEVSELPPEKDPTEIVEVEDDPKKRVPRAPVVTIMGHVDHGKTSLLDTIRKANVTSREAGGITQHIGAYQVNYQGKKITFLDTPGHEAFTSMRARGAKVTDVAILVVAADDGVMPQTLEAINHAKAAGVPIIVAINKMDKEGAAPDKVKQQLSEHDLLAEDWGGHTIMVPVSAHKQTGITDLLEMILIVAEMQELTANPTIPAQGTIVEAQLDKGRGPVATVLVQKGTLHLGDTILAGFAYGKVRAMINERGESLKKAGPSTPVEVLGLSDVPMAGDILNATDERIARSIAEKRMARRRTEEIQQNQKVSLDDIFQQIQEGKIKELNIVVKADVQGTIEALRQSLQKIKNEEVKVVIVHSGVGAINESDVMLASAANALIIGFNVRPDANARKIAESEKVDVRLYRVIYDALNDVEAAIKGMLAPKFKEVIQGRVEVRQIITISKLIIAGCYVTEGKVTRTSKVRLLRDNVVVYEGEIEALKRFKDDVKEVAAGYECGITLDKFRDIKEGDIIEPYVMEEVEAI